MDSNNSRWNAAIKTKELTANLLKECAKLQGLNPISQVTAGKRLAPILFDGVSEAHHTITDLMKMVLEVMAENQELKRQVNRIPEQNTNLININGSEGFKWQVTLLKQ